MHVNLVTAWGQPDGQVTVAILLTLVVLMIASQFFTQLQIISKNLSPEAKTGQATRAEDHALRSSAGVHLLGCLLPARCRHLLVRQQPVDDGAAVRRHPRDATPGSDAAKAREERLARKGKAIDANGKVVPLEKYQAEQQRLFEEAERARAAQPKRQQPVGKQRRRSSSSPARARARHRARRRNPAPRPPPDDPETMMTTSRADRDRSEPRH